MNDLKGNYVKQTTTPAINSITDNSSNAYSGYCQYRLPCGYCEKLMRDCPKYNNRQYEIRYCNNVKLNELY